MNGFGLLLVAIADSSFFSVPEGNDALIVMLSTGSTWRSMAYYVAMTTIGSVVGCLILYTVGRKGGSPLLRRRFSEKNIKMAERLFERYGILTVVIPSMMPPPFPFKVFVLGSGVFRLRIWEFLGGVLVGRTIRYTSWGILGVMYGQAVKSYMQHNMQSAGLVLLALFLVAVIAAWVWRSRRTEPEESKGA